MSIETAVSQLKELTQSGQKFEGYVLVQKAEQKQTKNGDPYFDLELAQKETKVGCKLWSSDFGDIQVSEIKDILKEGEVVFVTGVSNLYRDTIQLNIKSYRAINDTDDTDDVDLSEFVASAPLSKNELKEQIEKYINSVSDPLLKEIATRLLAKYETSYYEYPAAQKMHHAVAGGLAWHSLTLMKISDFLSNLYPSVNRDLMIVTAAAHDIGKCDELSGPIATKYTNRGSLIGHINLAIMEIEKVVQELREEFADTYFNELNRELSEQTVMQLIHNVVSHHGKLEWGSNVVPATLEAQLFHLADMIDSRANGIITGLENANEGEITKVGYDKWYKPITE